MASPDIDPNAPSASETMEAGLVQGAARPYAPEAPSFFEGFGGKPDESGWNQDAVTNAIHQQVLYGAAWATHMLANADPGDEMADTEAYQRAGVEQAVEGPKGQVELPIERFWRQQADRLTPKPGTTGTGTQIVSGLAGFATQLAAGGGVFSPLTAGGISAYEAYYNAKAQGVSDQTAERLALSAGGQNALFAAIPGGALARNASLAARTLQSGVLGIGANTVIGATGRYIDHKILADAGYDKLAQQYQALDGTSVMTDAALGMIPAALHLMPEAMAKMVQTAGRASDGLARDGASVTADARAQTERAPGIPLSAQASVAHAQADRTALEQVISGRNVDLSETALADTGADFLQKPQDPAAIAEAKDAFQLELTEGLREAGIDHEDPQVQRVAQALGIELPKPAEATPEEPPAAEPHYETTPSAEGIRQGEVVAINAEGHPEHGKLAQVQSIFRHDQEEPFMARVRHQEGGQEAMELHQLQPLPRRVETDAELRRMAQNAGWAQEGGRLIRSAGTGVGGEAMAGGKVVGRTSWIPREPWFAEVPHLPGKDSKSARASYEQVIEDHLAGRPLKAQERRVAEAMHEVARETVEARAAQAPQDHAEMEERSPTYQELPDRAQQLVAVMTHAHQVDADATARIMNSLTDERPEEMDRVERELQGIIDAGRQRAVAPADQTGVPGSGGEGPLELEPSPSDQELAERQRVEKADQQSLRTAQERQRADEERDRHPFTLTGSDRLADADVNQRDLTQAVLAERPDAALVDANGRPQSAHMAVQQVDDLEAQARTEADAAMKAATDCASRFGG